MLWHLLTQNWKDAFSEVLASIIGTIGIVFVIASIISRQDVGGDVGAAFLGYFSGGQIGLPALALSGIIFIALRRHGRLSSLVSVLLYLFLIIPIICAAVIVGMNPGFKTAVLSDDNLKLLWLIFFWLNLLWLAVLLLQPVVPSPQEAGEGEQQRVQNIKAGAADRE